MIHPLMLRRRAAAAALAALFSALFAACDVGDDAPGPGAADPCADDAVRAIVTQFGERLRLVSTLAPDSVIVRAARDAYATLVADSLLERWVADPPAMPGRDVSSPWPDRIEIADVRSTGDARAAGDVCVVTGDVVYVTSADTGDAAAARQSVTLRVVREGGAAGGWLIAAYEPGATSPTAEPPAERPGAGDDPLANVDSAAAVIRRYYAAIDARDYRTAYALWGDGGARSGQSFDAFAAGFVETASVTATISEPGRIEGAAGSRYVTVPVEIRAVTRDGAVQRFSGTYTLRRSVVDGATDEQRRWRIDSADVVR